MKKIFFTLFLSVALQNNLCAAEPNLFFAPEEYHASHFLTSQIEKMREAERREFQRFTIEAEGSNGKAAFYLGIYYKDGCKGVVEIDYQKAKSLFQKAESSHHLSAEQEKACQLYLKEIEERPKTTVGH